MGYSPFWVAACMFALQTAGFAAAPIAGPLSDRMGRKSVMMTSMAMTAVVLVFMAFAGKSLVFVFFVAVLGFFLYAIRPVHRGRNPDRKSTRLNSSHGYISYAVFCLKKKKKAVLISAAQALKRVQTREAEPLRR